VDKWGQDNSSRGGGLALGNEIWAARARPGLRIRLFQAKPYAAIPGHGERMHRLNADALKHQWTWTFELFYEDGRVAMSFGRYPNAAAAYESAASWSRIWWREPPILDDEGRALVSGKGETT
jgi:hypothetical protein